MLTRVDVNSENAFFVPILGATPKTSILLRKITGLNPPDPSLFIGDYSRDGGIYQGRRVGNRNIVLTMDLNPNPALGETIPGLREMLYKAFLDPQPDADYIQLTFHLDDGRILSAVGYTEKFETEVFDVETMAQISIICPDPYFRDTADTLLTHPNGWTTVPFTYQGSAETGFTVFIHVLANTPTITLENNGKTMVLNRTFLAGDDITISTVRGARVLSITSGGVTKSILASLTPTSTWLELHSQANTLKVYGATTADLVATVRQLKYRQAYWGI